MPRRKPFSAKQKKEQMKDKRAVKRGELDPSDVRVPSHPTRANRPGNSIGATTTRRANPDDPAHMINIRLQSKFTALTPAYLDRTRDLAHTVPLPRPLSVENAIFPVEWMERDEGRLTCPARPKFRYGQTKKEVERNEEGMFNRWVSGTRAFVEGWVEGSDDKKGEEGDDGEGDSEGEKREEEDEGDGEKAWGQLRSPTWFETNLEVWRQLWRVTESSQILLLLADARCPPLHLPPSLRTYVQSLKPRKEVILILTKSDLVDANALAGWREWVKAWWAKGYKASEGKGWADEEDRGEVQVVAVHSYDTDALYAEKPRHRPDLPESSLRELISALRTAHTRLMTPPERVKSDPEKTKNWRSPVRSQVDWDLLARGPASAYPPVGADTSAYPHARADLGLGVGAEVAVDGERTERDPEHEPLTIGLIGQPNVGKSSLLNAVLGESRVRASRQPGKTKHFQTLFWGWKRDVKVVDCPGLVCPSLVGLEVQALCGILPISQIPSMHACILTAGHLLPLEDIFKIPAQDTGPSDAYADKRTWRTPRPEEEQAAREKRERWTAGGIMEARALDRGYLTAKGGRPDGNRAANGIMRQLADGKIRWCFFPPGCESDRAGKGIWLGDFAHDDKDDKEDVDSGPDTDDEVREKVESEEEDDSEDDGEVSEAETKARNIDKGFFAALEDSGEEDESEEEEEESGGSGTSEGGRDGDDGSRT